MKEIICAGCKQIIETKKEKYTHIEDLDCEYKTGESWWHLNCFKKAMNRELTQLEKVAQQMLNKAGVLYNNLPSEFTQEKYEIN